MSRESLAVSLNLKCLQTLEKTFQHQKKKRKPEGKKTKTTTRVSHRHLSRVWMLNAHGASLTGRA